jgi:hypothetical protein
MSKKKMADIFLVFVEWGNRRGKKIHIFSILIAK